MKGIFLLSVLATALGCGPKPGVPEGSERIKSPEQAIEDLTNGTVRIYYSGPHSGYDEPTPVGLNESDWRLIEQFPRDYCGEVMASAPIFMAAGYNEAVVEAIREQKAEPGEGGNSE